jgi:hypothetical protein
VAVKANHASFEISVRGVSKCVGFFLSKVRDFGRVEPSIAYITPKVSCPSSSFVTPQEQPFAFDTCNP